jgi:hypothetical protein
MIRRFYRNDIAHLMKGSVSEKPRRSLLLDLLSLSLLINHRQLPTG